MVAAAVVSAAAGFVIPSGRNEVNLMNRVYFGTQKLNGTPESNIPSLFGPGPDREQAGPAKRTRKGKTSEKIRKALRERKTPLLICISAAGLLAFAAVGTTIFENAASPGRNTSVCVRYIETGYKGYFLENYAGHPLTLREKGTPLMPSEIRNNYKYSFYLPTYMIRNSTYWDTFWFENSSVLTSRYSSLPLQPVINETIEVIFKPETKDFYPVKINHVKGYDLSGISKSDYRKLDGELAYPLFNAEDLSADVIEKRREVYDIPVGQSSVAYHFSVRMGDVYAYFSFSDSPERIGAEEIFRQITSIPAVKEIRRNKGKL